MFHLFKLYICYLHNRSRKRPILDLYQVDVHTKHAQNEKHFNSTKRNINRRVRAIYYYWYNTRSCGHILFVLQSFQWSCIAFFTIFPCFICSKQCGRQSSKTNAQECTTDKCETLATTVWKWCNIWRSSHCRRQHTTAASKLPHQNTTFSQLLVCLAQRLSALTSRCRMDKAGREALERPPKTALKRSDWPRNSSSENLILRPRRNNLLTKCLSHERKKKSVSKALHGCRHLPAPMLRVGQGSTSNSSIQHHYHTLNTYACRM